MEHLADLDPAAVDADEFARQVAKADTADLEQLMAGEHRDAVLEQVFGRMPERFRPDKAKGLDAVFHWKVFDKPGGGYDHLEVVVRDRTCTTNLAPTEKADVTMKVKPATVLKLIAGANPMKAALKGDLRVQGDIGLARKFAGLFELPKS